MARQPLTRTGAASLATTAMSGFHSSPSVEFHKAQSLIPLPASFTLKMKNTVRLLSLLVPLVAFTACGPKQQAAAPPPPDVGDKTLPRSVKSCLHWCADGTRAANGALVAQLHGILKMNEELCPAYVCLREIAHHAGVRFFSEVVELPEDELDCSLDAIHERAQPNTSL
jgi:hypothetical protein